MRLSYNELTQSGSKSIYCMWLLCIFTELGQTVSSNNSRLVSNTVENTLLLELAKKQQMNTDIRRTIFTVIMSSEVIHVLHTSLPFIKKFYLVGMLISM